MSDHHHIAFSTVYYLDTCLLTCLFLFSPQTIGGVIRDGRQFYRTQFSKTQQSPVSMRLRAWSPLWAPRQLTKFEGIEFLGYVSLHDICSDAGARLKSWITLSYSCRRATTGSTRVARRAGPTQARRPTNSTVAVTAPKVHGSVGLTCHS